MAIDEDAQAVACIEEIGAIDLALTRRSEGDDGLPPARDGNTRWRSMRDARRRSMRDARRRALHDGQRRAEVEWKQLAPAEAGAERHDQASAGIALDLPEH